jgi:hypothetical protein
MSCDVIASQLTDYVKLELTRAEADQVAAHLNSCPNCREIEAEIRKNFGLLHFAPAASPSPHLWTRIDAAIDRIESEADQIPTRSAPLRWAAALAALAATILVAAAVTIVARQGEPAKPTAVARLEKIGPGVTIFRTTAEGRSPIAIGGEVRDGETITMDPGAAAIFTMPGVGRFRVSGGTTLKIAGLRLLELSGGELIADITPGGKGFTVQTPDARAVVRGTLFRIHAAHRRTALTVARGVVTFGNARGLVDVRAGARSEASAGQAPEAPLDLAADAADWDLFRSVAPGPTVRLQVNGPVAHGHAPFQIVLSSEGETAVESGVSDRTYVILTLEDPSGQRRHLRLTGAELTARYEGLVSRGIATLDRNRHLTLTGDLKDLDTPGRWTVFALYASGGRDETWAGYAESPPVEIEVSK